MSGIRSSLLAVALAAAAGAIAPAAGQANVSAVVDTTADTALFAGPVGVLRPGDELNVVIFRNEELTGKYLIDSRGLLQIPGLGVIRVAGLTPEAAVERLRAQLIARGFTSPEIAVQPLVRISVLGEVRDPGLYTVEPGRNLLQLITLAGGPNERADLEKTVVVREGRQIPINVRTALAGGEAGRLVLYSNDVLFLPRENRLLSRENLSFVFSAVTVVISILNVYLTMNR